MEKHHTHHKAFKPGGFASSASEEYGEDPVLVPKMGSWKFPVMFTTKKKKHVSNGACSSIFYVMPPLHQFPTMIFNCM